MVSKSLTDSLIDILQAAAIWTLSRRIMQTILRLTSFPGEWAALCMKARTRFAD